MLQDIARGDAQVAAVAGVIRAVRADVLLLLEFDFDHRGRALDAFAARLAAEEGAGDPIAYPHRFAAAPNTGAPSGADLDRDGVVKGPGDAFGFGVFPGQYGMALLSRLPIAADRARAFRRFRWADMPGARLPAAHYGETAGILRLSSKSHWDVPVTAAGGREIHVLAAHPTPPVFDGPEDANGRRNADEIRFWRDYIAGAGYIADDSGRRGGLAGGAAFVLLGDLNADPADGDGRREAIRALLADPRVTDPRQTSAGGPAAAAAQGGPNEDQAGDPALDTADWRERGGPGNLRVDYALPSAGLRVTGGGVFWPPPGDPLHALVGDGDRIVSSDHRLVWVDVVP